MLKWFSLLVKLIDTLGNLLLNLIIKERRKEELEKKLEQIEKNPAEEFIKHFGGTKGASNEETSGTTCTCGCSIYNRLCNPDKDKN